MPFFIDHINKSIHQRQFAGDACGFLETPVEKREFTDSLAYIERLEKQESYTVCMHCQAIKAH